MKKNDWLLIASAIIFTILFYEHSAGINFLIFTILLSGLIAFFNPKNVKLPGWWYYAGISVLCGFSVFICDSALSIFATLLSWLVLSGKSYNIQNSLLVNLFFSFYSVISSFVYLLLDVNKRLAQNKVINHSTRNRVYLGVGIALVISVIFFVIYQEANPLFKDFTKKIDLSWIEAGWYVFTGFGFLVIYGLLFHRDASFIINWDLQANRTILNKQLGVSEAKEVSMHTFIALALFILLNVMLLFLNVLDINNLFISKTLPEGITLSDFVHSSVTAIVISILIALGLIILLFKDELNFNKYSKKLKSLVYLWIIQSTLMVISAMIRNSWYIEAYQLTYLRIGVYVFLFLCLVGLFFTFLKMDRIKSGWYLIRQNFEAWFLILAICSLVNWDKLITDYNVLHAKDYAKLDKPYLLHLSDAALPQMAELMFDHADTNSIHDDDFKRLSAQLYDFSEKMKHAAWQDFNLRDMANSCDIQELMRRKKINLLALNLRPEVLLYDIHGFNYIRSLSLKNTPLDFERIVFFKNLEHLVLESINRAEINKLVLNKQLKHLEITRNLYGNQDYKVFNNLKNLESLSLPEISNYDFVQLNGHPSLKVLYLNTLYQDQIGFIKTHNLSFKVIETEREKR